MISVCGRKIRITGRFLRIARVDGDRHRFLDDPEPMLKALKGCGTRVDIFTFMQRLTEREPKYSYPMEWENLAVLPVSTFDHWFTKQIRFAPRGRVRQAEKKGVKVREVPFDDALVKGIWEIYNESPVRQGLRISRTMVRISRQCIKRKRHILIAAFSSGRISRRGSLVLPN